MKICDPIFDESIWADRTDQLRRGWSMVGEDGECERVQRDFEYQVSYVISITI